MNARKMVKFTNIVGLVSAFVLIYWVFIFICVEVFGFRIFKNFISEMFLFSIFAILAVMAGALMVNIMLNLSRIADSKGDAVTSCQSGGCKVANFTKISIFLLSFPLIFMLLLAGNKLNEREKEKIFISAASSTSAFIDKKLLARYKFEYDWIIEIGHMLRATNGLGHGYNDVYLITNDTIANTEINLGFSQYSNINIGEVLRKESYIYSDGVKESKYLAKVFKDGYMEPLFTANNGKFAYFYPIKAGERTFVLLFADYMRYGKIGS